MQHVLAEKSNVLSEKEIKIDNLMEDIVNLGRELEISRKLLDESQVPISRVLFLSNMIGFICCSILKLTFPGLILNCVSSSAFY